MTKPLIQANLTEEEKIKIAKELLKPYEGPKEGSFGVTNLEKYILLPGEVYANDSNYPEILFPINRLSVSPDLEKVISKLKQQEKLPKDLNIENTALNPDYPQEYIGKITHEQALNIASDLGGFVLPLVYFNRVLAHLYFHSEKVHYGNGNKIDDIYVKEILNEIIEKRSPWRGEHLGDFYVIKGGELMTHHTEITPQQTLSEVKKPLDKSYLKKDGYIDLEDWLKNPTEDGFPRKKGKSHVHSWYPRENRVVRFGASSGRAGLDCGGDPSDSDPALGVRICVPKAHAKN